LNLHCVQHVFVLQQAPVQWPAPSQLSPPTQQSLVPQSVPEAANVVPQLAPLQTATSHVAAGHAVVVPATQVPLPLQVLAVVTCAFAQLAGAQTVPAG
jgi:hypothetical protein